MDRMMGDSALVIGGGFSGILAARVLADFFDRVIVCEKDFVPNDALPRRGVPQGPHIHGPLLGTMQMLSELFPALPAALVASGASVVNMGTETRTFVRGKWSPRRDFGLFIPMQTRGLLEHVMRGQLSLLGNVFTRQGCRVLGLSCRNGRIAGIAVRDSSGSDAIIEGDLVIDASGRGSRSRRWLVDLGYEEPRASQINVDLRYVSCLVKIPQGYPDAHIGLRIRKGARTATCFRVENDRWIVSLSGRFGDYPPTELGGVVQYAEAFTPEIAQRIRAGTVGQLACYSFPSSFHWHYEGLRRFPERFMPIGDTVMCLNPVYGQGMATAGCQARVLAGELSRRRHAGRNLDQLHENVLPRYAEVLEYPWMTVAVGDFALDRTTGDRPGDLDATARFAQALAELAETDPEVHRISLRVQQLLDAPEVLVRSGIRERVLARLAEQAHGSTMPDEVAGSAASVSSLHGRN
jgi:2-polyprenyl-6-methoxyphenol hydroxylase-like FAD-dependent oxidoreductase